MKPYVRIGLRIFIGLLLLVGLYMAAVLLHGTLNDYQPPEREALTSSGAANAVAVNDSVFAFLSWNLGYGGLGEESDFFFDHGYVFSSRGMRTRTSEELVQKNVEGILQTLKNTRSDFFLIQEIDRNSKRSYFIDQYEMLQQAMPDYVGTFSPNYRVPFVPIPVLEPWNAYGRTESGLATFSRFAVSESVRHQLPGEFPWPSRVFQLDRCISVHRIPVRDAKELVVVNLHLSAYDKGGVIKAQQMVFLREFLLAEYELGNYVVAGGDWNLCPPFFEFDSFMPGMAGDYTQINIEPDWLPASWNWIYDTTIPTNRKTRSPYQPGKSFITLIDFFLISPNLQALTVKNLDLQFRYSDHQPVYLEVKL